LTEQQAEKLQVKPHTQISAYLEKCCLLVSANNSYQRTSEDLAALTGINISHSTQQRLVHRQEFEVIISNTVVDDISIDGGKVRIRTSLGQESAWNDYKAVALGHEISGGYFKQNQALVDWVNDQPLADTVSCLGDGHDGIWNLFKQIAQPPQRREILDWYHLMENLHKVGDGFTQFSEVRALLWQGKVAEVLQIFTTHPCESATNFVAYLTKHRDRIPNYQYLQLEGCTIGSGAVESTVKQISRRLKISGAQWDAKNVDQVLKQRCAYLNGQFSTPLQPQIAY